MFIGCMLFVYMAASEVSAGRHGHHRQPRHQPVAVGGAPVTGCGDIDGLFSYSDTTITAVELKAVDEELPEHCIVKGNMNGRTGPPSMENPMP